MGVISRRVLPLCSICCVCCPALRARSRHPVKRYKTLLAEIFPRSQDGEPNERKIGKLCEYASKNPLRIPKINDYLEQKFYKNLRNENIAAVKIVLLVYGRLLSTCKTQMPLFASSFLGIVGTLLEETRQDEMQILGCHALVNFINNQVDTAYMFNLEGLVPKLCQLAEEVGDDERTLRLRSAGLEVLAFMVRFIGEQPHVSMNFENIISVTLENYSDQQQEHNPPFPKPQDVLPVDAYKNPCYWAQVCLHNMAQSAKEVTSVRHVLEPLFHKFDSDKLWLPEKGVAFSVLKYLQKMLEESDDRSHLLLAILVKHVDHKDVVKQPVLQLHIVNVATQLSKHAKQQDALVSIVGAIADLIKHLRKCLQRLSGDASDTCYIDLQCALENCISTLSCKVGDVGPILDTMAVLLEKLPISSAMARPSISALYRTAQVISSIPNITYSRKTFPDALFHHLLLAMSHPDHETRLLAHRVFSIVLIPSLSQPWSIHDLIPSQAAIPSLISQKVAADGSLSIHKATLETIDEETKEKENPSTRDGNSALTSMRLSGHQVSLVLTSIWIQATSMENTPANFEAMAHTYTLALSFILAKNSNHVALLRFFQLAFSLRSISLNQQGVQQPSQRRPLFMLASYMIIVSAKACHLSELISMVRSTLTEETVDPYLVLDEDIRLQAICTEPGDKNCYGSQADEGFAVNALSSVDLKDQQLKDTLSMHLVSRVGRSSEEQEVSNMKAQLSQCFLPDEEYPLGAPPCPQMELQPIHQNMPHATASTEEDEFSDESDHKTSLDIISVHQLLESVVETAFGVENTGDESSPAPCPYDQIKNQCEDLVTGKQHKMSLLQSFKEQHEALASSNHDHNKTKNQLEVEDESLTSIDRAVHVPPLSPNRQQSFRLPPLSPYDKFLKATTY
ncbi:protein SEMI-ROLLED LEAF 2 [Lactuca sativa]|uniref:protein SEMI-ROLLED LEAF 2 n=1 Tax=Lactuca sativa TaxID=4236 RepID=UPI000CD9CB1E|nr:protein SEMI-ROLLED LEAF 2 [Lactuca sativa]